MIDYDGLRGAVVSGLSEFLGIPVIRSNQNHTENNKLPKYPYISYTITTLKSENKGTWGEYEDGKHRMPVTQTWSVTALSDNNTESVTLADKAHAWLSHIGSTYLSDNDVIVKSVGSITNRDNVLTVEYEYRNGFDVVFRLFDVTEDTIDSSGYIKTAQIESQLY